MDKENKYFQKHAKKDLVTEEYYSEQAKKMLAEERKMLKEISVARDKQEREDLEAAVKKSRAPVDVKHKEIMAFIIQEDKRGLNYLNA